MTSLFFRNLLLVASGLAVTLAVAWWWLVFSQLVENGTMNILDVAPCLARDSDLFSLAQSLCKGTHFLGIRQYFAEAFWLAAGLFGFAIAIRLAERSRET
jgi:hypothetical protein